MWRIELKMRIKGLPKRIKWTAATIAVAGVGAVPVFVLPSTARDTSVPRNIVKPRISGTPMQGSYLRTSAGRWRTAHRITFAYRWSRCDGSGRRCSKIPGAQGRKYRVTASDVGHTIRVAVTGTARRSATVSTAPTDSVMLPSGLPLSTGRTLHVSPNGADTNTGTAPSQAWLTLGHALRTVGPGETIRVHPGTYSERLVFERSGTRRKPITLTAGPGQRPVLTERLKIVGDHLRVSDLAFDGPEAAIYVSGADHVEIARNVIRRVAGSALYVGNDDDPAADIHIIGNLIHNNGTRRNLDHGVYVGHARDGVVANNLIERNFAHGIKLGPGSVSVVAAHNTIVGNGRSGVMVGGDDEHASSGNRIANNLIAGNAHMGIRSFWEAAGVGSDNLAKGNLVFGHTGGDLVTAFGGIQFQGNLALDPLFRDAAARRYSLRPGSPAIDTALDQYQLPLDYLGQLRPRGPQGDLGAFESG